MRPLRTRPLPGGMREITITTINDQLLLRPSPEVNRAILGVIGRAHVNNPCVRVHAWVFVSTHYHMLISADSAADISSFIQFINCNITIRLNHINERRGKMWGHRFHGIDVTADAATQRWRLRYLLAHGVKENLVARVDDWPGATSLPWLRDGVELFGIWTSYTDLGNAMRRKSYVEVPGEFDTRYRLRLTVLPCWAQMAPAEWRTCVRDIIAEIEREHYERREAENTVPLGVAAILGADPHARLRPKRRRKAPLAHAPLADLAILRERRRETREWYTEASEAFRGGDWDVDFPPGTFRPLGGYVGVHFGLGASSDYFD